MADVVTGNKNENMGNLALARRNEGASMFDIVNMLVSGKIPGVTHLPRSLDDLVDWTQEVTKAAGRLYASRSCPAVFPEWIQEIGEPLQFSAFVNKSVVSTEKKESFQKMDEVTVNQTDVVNFPDENAVERAQFYIKNVFISIEPSTRKKNHPKCIVSVSDFSSYMVLLRRISELKMIQDQAHLCIHPLDKNQPGFSSEAVDKECRICWCSSLEVVLPCMHGFCSHCARRWVYKRLNCPYCRSKFKSLRRLQKDQWEVRSLL